MREDASRAAETRAYARLPVHSLAYIELSDENAGLILNISETGISVQAVQTLNSTHFPRMRFRLPGTEIPVEVPGRIVWQIKSKKEAGIEFVNPPSQVRAQIAQWIAEEPLRVTAAMARVGGIIEPAPEITRSSQSKTAKSAPSHKVPPAIPPAPTTPVSPHVAAPPISRSVPSPPPASVRTSQPTHRPRPSDHPATSTGGARTADAVPPNAQPAASQVAGSPSHRKLTASTKEPDSRSQAPRIDWRIPNPSPEFRNDRSFVDERRLPERIPALPQWNGYVAPGVGMEFRKPRRWWTYTAALGFIAALSLAALMMFNPDAIRRARIEALTHQTSTTQNDAQPVNPGQSANATAPTNVNPSAASPSPNPNPSAASSTNSNATGSNSPGSSPNTPPAQQPQSPNEAGSGSSTNPASPSMTQNERDRSPANPSQGMDQNSPRSSRVAPSNRPATAPSATRQANQYAYQSRRQTQGPVRPQAPASSYPRYSQPAYSRQGSSSSNSLAGNSGTYNSPRQTANNQTYSPSAQQSPGSAANSTGAYASRPQPSTTYSYNSAAQPGASTPAGRTQSNPPPASNYSSNTLTASSNQRPVQQRDQDAYARSSNNLAAESHTTSRSISQPQISSIEVPGSQSYPVPPSVPLVGVPSGLVGATSQFHAIRVTAELQSRSSQLAGNLQIGQLISSYSPAYPIGAAREGIEGTVKLDVIVGRDGTVRSVQVMSGPPMLASSAANAVRDWRYGETFLSGEAIETEQYVTIVFRLAK